MTNLSCTLFAVPGASPGPLSLARRALWWLAFAVMLGMLTFMFNWNAYLWPLVVLTEQNKRTLPIILTWYSTQHSSQANLVMAASVLIVIPVLIVFALSQKWIVRGLTLTGGR